MKLLENWLSRQDMRGSAVLCRAIKDGNWQWFCRLSGMRGKELLQAVFYADTMDAAVAGALSQVREFDES